MLTKETTGKLPLRCDAARDLTSVVIETERLLLRPIRRDDAAQIFAEFNDQVTRYMMPRTPAGIEETRAFIESALLKLARGEDLQLVITLKSTGEFLGCCGLHSRAEAVRPELGIWTKLSAHGNRFGREAIGALKAWADRHLKYDYLVYPVDRANIASRRIPESLGGEIYSERLVERSDGSVLDEVVYRIMAAAE